MSLGGARARLLAASKLLTQEWRQVSASWRDERQHDFDRSYMERLTQATDAALLAMTELDERLSAIRHDCT